MIETVRGFAFAALVGLSLAGWFAAPAAAQGAPAPQAIAAASRPAAAAADLERWLRDLAHPQFKVREDAAAALNALPDDSLPALIKAYKHLQGYEPRLGLRSAIEHVFFRKQLRGRLGFLGLQPRVEKQIFDPVLGTTAEVIFVSRVLPGFPAEKAGIKTGDMFLEFDGKPMSELMGPAIAQQPVRQQVNGGIAFVMPSPPQVTAFTKNVSQREPGSQVSIRMLRAEAKHREVKLTIADDPTRTLEGVTLLAINLPWLSTPFNEMIGPPMRPGLCVTAVARNSPAAAAGFKTGDVIVGVGNTPLPPNVTPEQFKSLLDNSQPGSTAVLLLSHVEQVRTTVTLGGRPVDHMNPEDREIAQARFAEWWRQQTGECSLRSPKGMENSIPKSGRALPDATVLP